MTRFQWPRIGLAAALALATTAASPALALQDGDPNFRLPNPVRDEALRARFADEVIARVNFSQGDPALGLDAARVEEPLRSQLDLPDGRGLIITGVVPDGPAAKAGLKKNDILLMIGDKPLADVGDLRAQHEAAGDEPVEIKILRGGKPQTIKAKLGKRDGPERLVQRFRVVREPGHEPFVIGVQVGPIDETTRSHLDLPEGVGLAVNNVMSGMPADKAGIKANDILVAINDKNLTGDEALREEIRRSNGKALTVKLLRGGKSRSVEVTPEKVDPATVRIRAVPPTPAAAGGEPWIGLPVKKVDKALRAHLDLPSDRGLIVTAVPPDGPAAKAGFQVNDILLTMGDKPLAAEKDLREQIRAADGKAVAVKILRAGKPKTLEVTPERRPAIGNRFPRELRWLGPGVMLSKDGKVTFPPGGTVDIDPEALARSARALTSGLAAPGNLEKRLDEIDAQLKALTKAVDELRNAERKGSGEKK